MFPLYEILKFNYNLLQFLLQDYNKKNSYILTQKCLKNVSILSLKIILNRGGKITNKNNKLQHITQTSIQFKI